MMCVVQYAIRSDGHYLSRVDPKQYVGHNPQECFDLEGVAFFDLGIRLGHFVETCPRQTLALHT